MADHARATITINAEPAAVMAAIADINTYSTWSGPVERSEIVAAGPDGRPRQGRFLVNAVVTKEEFVIEYTWSGDDSVSWTLVEGNNMIAQDGSYVLRDLGGGRTEVVYDLTVDLKIKIPGLLRRRVQSGVVDAALKDLKKHIES
ncbi:MULTISPECIES: SRPBCC family protein [Protofrankia]|uniref:Cyclase/dehydrase n=1 Tax=Candidatus Protofrankia californiensis TaxID=1839754 RepID=A0A1C3P842_9ACTN|nr:MULTISPECIES: SRPBCC family protein [Protofrankia]SBW25977.1 cyclase/dehydrase [Candidatus Protofrankia californiensis]